MWTVPISNVEDFGLVSDITNGEEFEFPMSEIAKHDSGQGEWRLEGLGRLEE